MASISDRNDKMKAALSVAQAHTFKNLEALRNMIQRTSKDYERASETIEHAFSTFNAWQTKFRQGFQLHAPSLRSLHTGSQIRAQEAMLGVMRWTSDMRELSKPRSYVDCVRSVVADISQSVVFKYWSRI